MICHPLRQSWRYGIVLFFFVFFDVLHLNESQMLGVGEFGDVREAFSNQSVCLLIRSSLNWRYQGSVPSSSPKFGILSDIWLISKLARIQQPDFTHIGLSLSLVKHSSSLFIYFLYLFWEGSTYSLCSPHINPSITLKLVDLLHS